MNVFLDFTTIIPGGIYQIGLTFRNKANTIKMEVLPSVPAAVNNSSTDHKDLIEWEDDVNADWHEVNLRFGSVKSTTRSVVDINLQ